MFALSRIAGALAARHSLSAVRGVPLVLAAAAVLVLGGCGGGGGATIDSAGNFNIGVTVAGTFVNSTPLVSGGSLKVSVRAGQSVSFDAGEPATWTLYVGNTAVSGGAQVSYAGVTLTATTVDRYAITVDTYAPYRLLVAVPITLVATSTFDAAQVATVQLLIGN
jgi:hypothetical protein